MTVDPKIRLARLENDHKAMLELAAKSPRISFRARGEPPEQYLVTLECTGLGPPEPDDGVPPYCEKHTVELLLHAAYPFIAPKLRQRTPIFHPNFLFGNERLSICIDVHHWTPQGSLADLVLRLGNLICYRSFNLEDPLDAVAADWAQENRGLFPLDDRPWFEPGIEGDHKDNADEDPVIEVDCGEPTRTTGGNGRLQVTLLETEEDSAP